ncbi:hypothetical protein EDD80_101295 [Anseongella ginsenosidimutans]|uniref:Uncharacterized protein n=1 Tax=Anseongella ginsenosidimutans TaxID=496056 RepID=A0A4R3KWE7_9SPHI|nr:hypothetical protein [Anseongella ginsenosidimutans]QEC51227.1 hypothetical protein FRZ59_01900 [Anseongella ginsenosidimutans]TCS90097.1 hypothetical protein EDD80_101295 [Anseongella ginsenosidimutans]
MKLHYLLLPAILFFDAGKVFSQTNPDEIQFVRQSVRRLIFDPAQSISLASLNPKEIVGLPSMYPVGHHFPEKAGVAVRNEKLVIQSEKETQTSIWFGGFNPFSTYFIDISAITGEGEIGFEFSDAGRRQQFIVSVAFIEDTVKDVSLTVKSGGATVFSGSIAKNADKDLKIGNQLIVQMLGSGLSVYVKDEGLPQVIGQGEFNQYLDLREIKHIRSFQSQLHLALKSGKVEISRIESALTTGIGLADIRAITYENGEPLLDQGRIWYTMTIRGRGLPHPVQGVFSLNPGVFDLRLEGIIVFDRNDGLLRNEVASHIFYDRNSQSWKGITTGFSAFANKDTEKKQLLAVLSDKDPRFGFSVMKAAPMGIVGNIEDPHIIYDEAVDKWRMLACENISGFKCIMLESAKWNGDYSQIAGPGTRDATGTSIQKIDGRFFCFSGSSEREVYIYSYPDLKEVGTLKMDLPPWDEHAGTRIWPNVVQLPDGYPVRYVALMMDRYNYPGVEGPNWTYGAIYLYYGH